MIFADSVRCSSILDYKSLLNGYSLKLLRLWKKSWLSFSVSTYKKEAFLLIASTLFFSSLVFFTTLHYLPSHTNFTYLYYLYLYIACLRADFFRRLMGIIFLLYYLWYVITPVITQQLEQRIICHKNYDKKRNGMCLQFCHKCFHTWNMLNEHFIIAHLKNDIRCYSSLRLC